jgi:pilus assembly protein Flp/PilA
MLGDNARTAAQARASGLARTVMAVPTDEAKPVQILLRRFLNDDSAATAIEYALIVAGIALAIAGAITTLGTGVIAKFDFVKDNVQ